MPSLDLYDVKGKLPYCIVITLYFPLVSRDFKNCNVNINEHLKVWYGLQLKTKNLIAVSNSGLAYFK